MWFSYREKTGDMSDTLSVSYDTVYISNRKKNAYTNESCEMIIGIHVADSYIENNTSQLVL